MPKRECWVSSGAKVKARVRDTGNVLGDDPLAAGEVEILECLIDGDEPTVLVVDMLNDGAPHSFERDDVERRLIALEARGLVSRSRASGGDAKHGVYEDDWWRVTEAGWCALAKSGEFAGEPDVLLSGDGPPVRRAVALLLLDGPRTVAELTDELIIAWGDPPGPPAAITNLAPRAFASVGDVDRIRALVERRVGHLALDGLVAPEASARPEDPRRWQLTDTGRTALAADSAQS